MEKYEFIEDIRNGSTGVVSKYYDSVAKEDVAIKRMFVRYDQGGPELVLEEASLLNKWNHVNIIRVFDVIDSAALLIVHEYLPFNLKQFMEVQSQRMKKPRIIKSFLHQILSGVAYLHAQGSLHLDLNPDNLLIDLSGKILKVAALGLATKRGVDRDQLETLPYKAPEFFFLSPEPAAPADMWAVGCVFAEMVTQKTLFPGTCDSAVLLAIIRMYGLPTEDTLPGVEYGGGPTPTKILYDPKEKNLEEVVTCLDPTGFQLLSKMLTLNPGNRITAQEALCHAYFNDL